MKLVSQMYNIIYPVLDREWEQETFSIEKAARNCYQSDINTNTRAEFIRRLVKRGHHAMLEFGKMTVQFVTDRGVSHEIVRHRLFSFAQESTRYCNYEGKEIEFIVPSEYEKWDRESEQIWYDTMLECEDAYKRMLKDGCSPQQARSVLPNSLKTSVVVSGNFREWRHFFDLRTAQNAHPDMIRLVAPLQNECISVCPEVFGV